MGKASKYSHLNNAHSIAYPCVHSATGIFRPILSPERKSK